ncbi:hypothetical protein AVEN_267252-1 [Araneus ventricosus]|uniref:Uncharacterized protein n=1 Tax=Araneus ventricosus TaxID=182803 RepID=A0A4Y2SFJ6_ARAVE|nr:hypothetical protein AVEN_267252-1 [Araneus ventricosus]
MNNTTTRIGHRGLRIISHITRGDETKRHTIISVPTPRSENHPTYTAASDLRIVVLPGGMQPVGYLTCSNFHHSTPFRSGGRGPLACVAHRRNRRNR